MFVAHPRWISGPGSSWVPVNLRLTRNQLHAHLAGFSRWLESHMWAPWALLAPVLGDKLTTDPYIFVGVDPTPAALHLLGPETCPYTYQTPSDPATGKVAVVDGAWIESVRAEYQRQLDEHCSFQPGDSVLIKQTRYVGLRGIVQRQSAGMTMVRVNLFSTTVELTLPSRYLERITLEQNEVNNLGLCFCA